MSLVHVFEFSVTDYTVFDIFSALRVDLVSTVVVNKGTLILVSDFALIAPGLGCKALQSGGEDTLAPVLLIIDVGFLA